MEMQAITVLGAEPSVHALTALQHTTLSQPCGLCCICVKTEVCEREERWLKAQSPPRGGWSAGISKPPLLLEKAVPREWGCSEPGLVEEGANSPGTAGSSGLSGLAPLWSMAGRLENKGSWVSFFTQSGT